MKVYLGNNLAVPSQISINIFVTAGQMNFVLAELDTSNQVVVRVVNDFHAPNLKGHPLIRLAASVNNFKQVQFELKHSVNGKVATTFTVGGNQSLYVSGWQVLIAPGRYLWNVKYPSGANTNMTAKWLGVLTSGGGGSLQVNPIKITSSEVAIFYITLSDNIQYPVIIPLIINNGAQISILWQIPQYVLISVGEILFSITGISFSYDQAPDGMKSLVVALWFLTVAFGNLLVMIIVKIHMVKKQSWMYLIFAITCVIFTIIFAVLAHFYRMRTKSDSNKTIEVTPRESKE